MSLKRLLTIGDSFTYGDELPDRLVDAYPYLLGESLEFDQVVNLGLRGGSSDYVFRVTIETLISERMPFDLVLVSWPEQSRFEAILEDPNYLPTIAQPHPHPTVGILRKPGQSKPEKELPWLTDYYKYSYNIAWGYRRQFNQIIALQGFLKSRNQDYFMFNVAGLQSYYNTYSGVFLKNQFNAIDKDRFIGWPKDGILEWQGDCPKAPGGHPLELGHQRIAKTIDEHIRNFRRIS